MGRTILIALVVAIVVGGAAGFGGYKLGDGAGFERANQVRQQFAQQRQTGQSGGANSGGAGAQGGFAGTGGGAGAQGGAGRGIVAVQGVIKSIEGDNVTVTVGNRDVTVKLSDKTQVSKAASGGRADLVTGARVMVTPEGSGTGSGSESVNAAAVLILPAQ